MIKTEQKKGFTLIEVLIAASLFVIVTSITATVLFNIIIMEKKSNILNAVYDDTRVVMEQLATMIHDNAIDYDEYYSVNVIQKKLGNSIPTIAYGMYQGVYSSRFYDPGQNLLGVGKNPEDLGVICMDAKPPESISECRILFKPSKDINTGKNPYEGREGLPAEETANAFCDTNMIAPPAQQCENINTSEEHTWNADDELYLISANGGKKTIIGRQLVKQNEPLLPNDYAIGMLELNGIDSDQNGIFDLYKCGEKYNCDTTVAKIKKYLLDPFMGDEFPSIKNDNDITDLGLSIATRENKNTELNNDTSNFVPITPFRSNVYSLKFIIAPVEDPYKAYAEKAMQTHPSVTILLTMEPSAVEKAKYPGRNPPKVIVQRTVTAGIHKKVESYPPTNELEWVKNLIQSVP